MMLRVPGQRYEYEMRVLIACARKGIPILTETIDTIYIDDNEGSHFRPIRDSFRVTAAFFLSRGDSPQVPYSARFLILACFGFWRGRREICRNCRGYHTGAVCVCVCEFSAEQKLGFRNTGRTEKRQKLSALFYPVFRDRAGFGAAGISGIRNFRSRPGSGKNTVRPCPVPYLLYDAEKMGVSAQNGGWRGR